MANRGTHAKALQVLARHLPDPRGLCALDVGAGMGALSARLTGAGYTVAACDLYPEAFSVPGIECRRVGGEALDGGLDARLESGPAFAAGRAVRIGNVTIGSLGGGDFDFLQDRVE
mgnify:CR=1 FL=1